MTAPRLAVRAVIVVQERLLLVNGFPQRPGDLWVAPGGGVVAGQSLQENLIREVHEECGLTITSGQICHVAEFCNADTGFHQVELYFHATLQDGTLDAGWCDPEGHVCERRFFTRHELHGLYLSPAGLPELAFGPPGGINAGPLTAMLRPDQASLKGIG